MAEVTSVEDVKPPTPVPGTEESEAALKNIERVLRELQRQRIEFVSNTKDITDSVDPAETLKQNAQKKVTRALHPFKSKNIKKFQEALEKDIDQLNEKFEDLKMSVEKREEEIVRLKDEINRQVTHSTALARTFFMPGVGWRSSFFSIT